MFASPLRAGRFARPVSLAAALTLSGLILVPPAGAAQLDLTTPVTFDYVGASVQTWTVPQNVGALSFVVIGGGGGINNSTYQTGSSGAEVTGTVPVQAGDEVQISVAGAGGGDGIGIGTTPGWGGLGGSGGAGHDNSDSLRNSGAGGGASTVQITRTDGSTFTVVVAGGGGGKGGASGDPIHAGDGGDGGGNGSWTGTDGHKGTTGPLGGEGGAAGAASTAAGEDGPSGSESGGAGGGGGGGVRGGNAGHPATAASAGGGGGAGSSMVDASVTAVTIKASGVRWSNPLTPTPAEPVPNGSVVLSPIVKPAVIMNLSMPQTQVAYGAAFGPLTASVTGADGTTPTGIVEFFDITDATAFGLGTVELINGIALLQQPSQLVTLQSGAHQIQATWSGDPNYSSATSNVITFTVADALIDLDPAPVPITTPTATNPSGEPDTGSSTAPTSTLPTSIQADRSTTTIAAPPPELAATGSTPASLVVVAGGLIVLGVGTLVLDSRRRSRPGHHC